MNTEELKKIKDIGDKIIKLTEYGQPLHINDILPELKEIYDWGRKDGWNYACEKHNVAGY
jgi:hypothetical protein